MSLKEHKLHGSSKVKNVNNLTEVEELKAVWSGSVFSLSRSQCPNKGYQYVAQKQNLF